MLERFLSELEDEREHSYVIRHHAYVPPRDAVFGTLQKSLPQTLADGLMQLGISKLYAHQTAALEAVRRGENVVVVTPTASGKSLTYILPILEALLQDSRGSALLLFPLKALEQDQRAKLEHWQQVVAREQKLGVEIYDGDTPRAARARIKRNPPHLLLSNPDMLHQGILAFHQGWTNFLQRLKWIVIDELHAYRGVFGSHILQVFRRLSRLLAYYDVQTQFICLSATIANPLDLAERLTGRRFTLVERSGAPSGGRHVLLVEPKGSSTSTVAKLFVRALDSGLKTIVFSKARVTTEVIHRIVRDSRPDLAPAISSYRAGFLPEERRDIERRLAAGELRGVISTSALELGIDIGGLDVCILCGYPGSMMSFWQRSGRVGRRGEESAIILVAGSDALDHYFLSHPRELLERTFEAALVNAENEEVLRTHLPAAAAEIPLMEGDPHLDVQQYREVITALEHEGLLLRSASGRQWFSGLRRPHARVNLRSVGGTFEIVDHECGRAIGEIGGSAVFRECHEGAVYLHRGEQYRVTKLDLEHQRVQVRPVTSSIYTVVRSDKQTEILDDRRQRIVRSMVVHAGRLKVTETFHSYERRRLYTQELLSVEPLSLPPQSFVTDGLWIEIPPEVPPLLAREELHYMGGIHAFEHAAISLAPLFCLCDRNDVGGISFTRHPQLAGGAVFFYDGYPGGAGIAAHLFEIVEELVRKTHALIGACPCEEGCPSCIQSPKCGSGNKPLDKAAALFVLKMLLREPEKGAPVSIARLLTSTQAPAQRPQVFRHGAGIPDGMRVVVLDVETQRSAEDVGGWSEARQMRLAVAALWDSIEGRVFCYEEAQVEELLQHLKRADLVVGFNILRFDYEVLRGYTFENLRRLPTVDLLVLVERALGKRLKLDTLASATLGIAKSADGLQALEWFREGRLDLVREYCVRDVEMTRDLLLFALTHGYLLYERKGVGTVRVPVVLDLVTRHKEQDIVQV